ncbi:hypothetical protein [Kribbella sancticallisti]|uniref:hypothetical protein n=1 Tax=Kribbella sancticallisti TaxID=460087 RepID=UPI0031DC7427
MAGRRDGRALLGSGLLAVTLLGGAGGYGAGLLTTTGTATAQGQAGPLAAVSPQPSTPTASPTPTVIPKKIVPDNSPALQADDLYYKTRSFTATSVVRSSVSVRVPGNWTLTQPDPPTLGRFTDPTSKRWIRIEAGFTIRRPPAESMAARVKDLGSVPKNQQVTILSSEIDPKTQNATLVYTYVPEQTVRHVIVRWVANEDGLCHFEMATTGLPQDKSALLAVLDRATDSSTRSDSPL